MESADLFMSEYGCTFRYFVHDLSVSQVKYLAKMMNDRILLEQKRMIVAHHGEPNEMISKIDASINKGKGVKLLQIDKHLGSQLNFHEVD